jgi:peptidoglycan/xylan/chitin deacetylase (PgdA/CDA1 family)
VGLPRDGRVALQAPRSLISRAAIMVDVYLKGLTHPDARAYLSENGLRMRFSTAKKLYYSCVRPVVPLAARQWLQRKAGRVVACRPNFIWPDFVDLVRQDPEAWQWLTDNLYPEGCRTAIVLTHDVETQAGYDFIPKVIEVESRHGFKSSWNLVARKYRLHEAITQHLVQQGHEIGIHGFNHDGTLYYSRSRFRQRAAQINLALRQYRAVGFRSPQVHRDLEWLQDLEVLYDCSCFDYDPYQPFPGGTGSIWPFMAGKFVELPYTVPQDHTLFYVLERRDIGIWTAKTDWLVENRGMILVLTHPDYLMEQRHLALYEEFLIYLKGLSNAWHALPREMASRYASL